MSRSIDPVLRDYLRARIQEWVSEDGHTAKGFAKLADISGAQVSDAINKGSIGWTTMDGAMRVFGFKSVGALEAEAEKWAATRAPAEAAPTSRRGYRRLHERQEWAAVAAVVTDEHAVQPPRGDTSGPCPACIAWKVRRGGARAPTHQPPLAGAHRKGCVEWGEITQPMDDP